MADSLVQQGVTRSRAEAALVGGRRDRRSQGAIVAMLPHPSKGPGAATQGFAAGSAVAAPFR